MALTGHFDASDTDRLWKESGMTNHPANGEDVFAWDDEGDAADNALFRSANVPTYAAGALNGLGCIQHNGSTGMRAFNDGFTVQRDASVFLSSTGWTVLVAFQMEADASNNANMWTNTGLVVENIGNWGLHLKTSGGVHTAYAYQWDGASKSVGQTFTRDAPHVLMARLSGGSLFVSIDGAAETSIACGNLGGTSTFFAPAQAFNGKFGEIKTWNTGNADGNLAAEYAAFVAKWTGGGGGGPEQVVRRRRSQVFIVMP